MLTQLLEAPLQEGSRRQELRLGVLVGQPQRGTRVPPVTLSPCSRSPMRPYQVSNFCK